MDPYHFKAVLQFRAVPQIKGPLQQNYKEMNFVNINAATTHLHAKNFRHHFLNALKAETTEAEIL